MGRKAGSEPMMHQQLNSLVVDNCPRDSFLPACSLSGDEILAV